MANRSDSNCIFYGERQLQLVSCCCCRCH